jgi:hypothetical protein
MTFPNLGRALPDLSNLSNIRLNYLPHNPLTLGGAKNVAEEVAQQAEDITTAGVKTGDTFTLRSNSNPYGTFKEHKAAQEAAQQAEEIATKADEVKVTGAEEWEIAPDGSFKRNNAPPPAPLPEDLTPANQHSLFSEKPVSTKAPEVQVTGGEKYDIFAKKPVSTKAPEVQVTGGEKYDIFAKTPVQPKAPDVPIKGMEQFDTAFGPQSDTPT